MREETTKSLDKKDKPKKTPLEKALYEIKWAYMFAFISAFFTATLTILSIYGFNPIDGVDIFNIGYVIFILLLGMVGGSLFTTSAFLYATCMLVLGILLLTIKSRIAAVVLSLFFLCSRIEVFYAYPASLSFMVILVSVIYFLGIRGTFSYHKIKKQQLINDRSYSGEL